MYDLRIINGLCFIDDMFIKKNIYVKDEKISMITCELFPALRTIDAHNLKVLPGLIDPHVHLHLNIGHKFSVDDFASGSALAASGGVTTIIDFLDPINSNDEFETSYIKRLFDAKSSNVDYTFHTTLGNYKDDINELNRLVTEKGMTSIKVFTTYSSSNRMCSYEVIESLMSLDKTILVHSEDDDMIIKHPTIDQYEASRSEASEWSAIDRLTSIQKTTGGRMYIVHISSGQSLEKINLNDNLFLESCPQYFELTKDLFDHYDGKKFLLAPPLRDKASIEKMKEFFYKLDTIGTDHCPFLLEDKLKSFDVDSTPKGIGSLGLAFPIMFTLFGESVIKRFTKNPAQIFDLKDKGEISVGKDADFAIINERMITQAQNGYSKCDYSVYQTPFSSKVVMTILRGDLIYSDNKVYRKKGRYIRRHHESNH